MLVRDHHALRHDGFFSAGGTLEFLTIALIALALAQDALAVSLALGTTGEALDLRGRARLVFHFGIFQAGMAALGWLAGETVVGYVAAFDHWIAFALLAYVAFRLIRAGLGKTDGAHEQDPSRGQALVILSFATSIDAFAVGLTIALLQVPVLASIVSIGVVTWMLSAIGFFAGSRLGEMFGRRMQVLGGLMLLAIGVRVVITHLLA